MSFSGVWIPCAMQMEIGKNKSSRSFVQVIQRSQEWRNGMWLWVGTGMKGKDIYFILHLNLWSPQVVISIQTSVKELYWRWQILLSVKVMIKITIVSTYCVQESTDRLCNGTTLVYRHISSINFNDCSLHESELWPYRSCK